MLFHSLELQYMMVAFLASWTSWSKLPASSMTMVHTHNSIFAPKKISSKFSFFSPSLSGILLHFDDSLLSDLYFVNPQWLCSLMADVVTVQERNPFQKNGTQCQNEIKFFKNHTNF